MVTIFKLVRLLFIIFMSCFAVIGYSWNAIGHQLVAQIAYDNLTPAAIIMCQRFLPSSKTRPPEQSFVRLGSWLDAIRGHDIHWFDAFHYIDIPFTTDGTALPPIAEINALWAAKEALSVLRSPKSTVQEKTFSLRVLIHVIGDIHQPLHAAAKVTQALPKGDLGGNLFPLGKNPVGRNLHEYWDNGAGALLFRHKKLSVKMVAQYWERKLPCTSVNVNTDLQQWIKDSHQLALDEVYTLAPFDIPQRAYQSRAQAIVEQQIVSAGCRLANLINQIAK